MGEGTFGVPDGDPLCRDFRRGSDALELELELTADGKPEFKDGFAGRDTTLLVGLESSVVLPEWLAEPERVLAPPEARSAAAVNVRVKYWSVSVAQTEMIILACMCALA